MLTLSPSPPSPSTGPAASSAGWIAALLHLGDTSTAGRIALATPGPAGWREQSYAELDQRSRAVSGWLVERRVGPGQRVVLHGDPSGAWVCCLFGILRVGAVAVPLDPRLTADELTPILARSAPAAALVSGRLRAVTGEVAGTVAGELGLDVASLDLEAVDHLPVPRRTAGDGEADGDLDEPAVIAWTSGTTGRPKGVTLTYANLAYAVAASVRAQRLDGSDRWLSVLPLNHLLELTCGVLGALGTGATLSFGATLMPREIAELLVERRITRMMVVPLLARLLRPELEAHPPTHLRTLFAGGAPLDAGLVDAYATLGIPLLQGYGMTETAPTVAMNTLDHHRRGSVGRPLPGTEVRIAPDGEILVRSPAVMAGYWDDDALTGETVNAGGWLHTGDLGRLDGDGYLFVTGRAKDLIVLESGKKVQPEEVEAALQRSTRFADVCVVGVQWTGGSGAATEQVCAVVVPRTSMTTEEVGVEVSQLTTGLSGYKRPRLVDVWTHDLPRTAKRSVRRAEVARQAALRLRARQVEQ